MEKKVLFISYWGPPYSNIGALRVEKFLKYLPLFGYQPYLVCSGVERIRNPFIFRPKYIDLYFESKKAKDIIEPILQKLVKGEKNNYYNKTKIPNIDEVIIDSLKPKGLWPLSEVRIPDKFFSWIIPSVFTGLKLLNQEKFDIIYSSSGPPSSAIVASILQRCSNLPWIAEFRDLWSDNHVDIRKTYIHKIDNLIERITLSNVHAFVTVSEPLKEILYKKYSKPSFVIYNGYDPEDYPLNVELTKKFTITYTGKIYLGKRDPGLLFEVVSGLSKKGIINVSNFEIRFWGSELDIVKDLANKYGIEDYVYIGGKVPYKESLKHQKESWLLLLLEWNDPRAKGVLTGKVFEYLGSGRPILSISYNEGALNDLLEKTKSGVLLNSYEELEEFLTFCIKKYNEGDKSLGFNPLKEEILKYSRKEASRNLSQIFDSLLERNIG